MHRGGVGNFAIQLARLSGAKVIAHLRRSEQEATVKAAGAQAVLIGEDLPLDSEYAPYDLVIESVGGKTLTAALGSVALDGTVVLFGTSGGNEVTFNAQRFYGVSSGANLYALILFHELKRESASVGLQRLLDAGGRRAAPTSNFGRSSLDAGCRYCSTTARSPLSRKSSFTSLDFRNFANSSRFN